jgi:hypothetical protein
VGSGHSWVYELIVDLDGLADVSETCVGTIHNVTYEVSNVDDGDIIVTTHCTESTAVTYTANAGPTTDTNLNHTSRCPFDCSVTGASILLLYD